MNLCDTAFTSLFAGVAYLVHPQVLGTVRGLTSGDLDPRAAVIINYQTARLGDNAIEKKLAEFEIADDVYTPAFNDVLIIQATASHSKYDDGGAIISSLFNDTCVLYGTSGDEALPEGPYFLKSEYLHQAWRLYDDILDAFVTPVIPENPLRPDKFCPLVAATDNGIYKRVGVPSRLYSWQSPNRPLSGKRLTLKDNFCLAGIQTTMTNRAWTQLYPPETHNSVVAQQLLDLGAVIVGKTKMNSFASGEEPTDQWIDYDCPFNPRMDFYQTPSGSTTGGGVSLAGYDWLDYAIGTDTTGSIRSPAGAVGLFGMRPSYGVTSLVGVVESCRIFDTVGVLSRSIDGIHDVYKAATDLEDSHKFPTRIIYPTDFYPQEDANQQAMTEAFVQATERFLNVKRENMSFRELWKHDPPREANNRSLDDFLKMSAPWPFYWYNYHASDDFRIEYETKYDAPPYVGPYIRRRWELATPFTAEDRDRGVHEMEIFRTWFKEKVIAHDGDMLSNAVMFMPFGSAQPKYRDQHNPLPSIVPTYSVFYLTPTLQMPQLIVPVGQKPFHSRVSNRTEYRPIVSSFVGAKGSDLMLLNLAKAVLRSSKWPSEVLTGRFMFEVAKNERYTADVVNAPEEVSKLHANAKLDLA